MTHFADGTVSASSPTLGLIGRPLAMPVVLALLAGLLITAPNLIDPMIRYDDYPALFADAAAYWHKTKEEGRWLNYLWHLRETVTPAWLNYALYQSLWALMAGFVAVAALRDTPSRAWFATVLALLILVAPSATLIGLWFNTLLPGMAFLALYAGLSLVVTPRTHLALLVPFTVISFTAYTTYPLLLLAIALLNRRNRNLRDLIMVLTVFVASFALAVLSVYTLNLMVHGVFGVPVGDWRNATPAHDWASLVGNLPLVAESFWDLLITSSFVYTPMIYFHLGLLVCATVGLLRHSPMEALYLHAGLACGFALVIVQILKVGVITPPRAFLFAWLIYAVLITRAAQVLTAQGGMAGRMMRLAVLLIVGSYLLLTFQQNTAYRAWQSETRALAEAVVTHGKPVAIADEILDLPSARMAYVQNSQGLSFRLQQLTGQTVPVCIGEAVPCCPTGTNCPTLLRVKVQDGVPRIVFE